eukprot:Gb_20495 [translate_table: standard]
MSHVCLYQFFCSSSLSSVVGIWAVVPAALTIQIFMLLISWHLKIETGSWHAKVSANIYATHRLSLRTMLMWGSRQENLLMCLQVDHDFREGKESHGNSTKIENKALKEFVCFGSLALESLKLCPEGWAFSSACSICIWICNNSAYNSCKSSYFSFDQKAVQWR